MPWPKKDEIWQQWIDKQWAGDDGASAESAESAEDDAPRPVGYTDAPLRGVERLGACWKALVIHALSETNGRFAQVAVPAVFAEEIAAPLRLRGFTVEIRRSLTARFRMLTATHPPLAREIPAAGTPVGSALAFAEAYVTDAG